jgi:hypothetical protein
MAKSKKEKITPLGVTNFRRQKKRFGIKQKNRASHIYILGKTGTGKSTLLKNMAISDIRRGEGLALIDPHGDLVKDILNFIPKKRLKEVIYFNPEDTDYPVAFNPLEEVSPNYRHLVSSGLISVFKKIWYDFWGPRLEHILRYALLTLLESPESTLLDLPRLLTDKEFRKEILARVKNREVKDFWFSEFEKYSFWLKSEAVSPILNKVGQFLASAPVRNIIGQRRNTFSLRKVMDEGKILLCNLAKGRIGEDSSSLLGAMLVTKIWLSSLSRADIPEEKRRPFYLYVDEIQNFLTLSFSDILAEARKYGLNLILSNQYLFQLDKRVKAAIFGNVGTIITFRVGVEDAKYLAEEFYPYFERSDLISLPNYHIYLKLMINGVTSRAFSAKTLLPPKRRTSYKKEVIEASKKRYGRPRNVVEREIISESYLEVKKQTGQRALFF